MRQQRRRVRTVPPRPAAAVPAAAAYANVSFPRHQQVVQRHRLVAHVDVALEPRIHRHHVVPAVHLDALRYRSTRPVNATGASRCTQTLPSAAVPSVTSGEAAMCMTTPSASHVVCGETVVTRTPGSSAPERVDVRRRNRHPERQVTTVEVDELHRHRKATPTCFAERDALNGLGSDNDPPSDDDPISVLQVDSRRARQRCSAPPRLRARRNDWRAPGARAFGGIAAHREAQERACAASRGLQ